MTPVVNEPEQEPSTNHTSLVSAQSVNDAGNSENGPLIQEALSCSLQVPEITSDSESSYGDTLTQTSITKLLSKKFKVLKDYSGTPFLRPSLLWPFKRDDLSSGVDINTFMFGFTLSNGLSTSVGLSSGWPLKRGSTVIVFLYIFFSEHTLCFLFDSYLNSFNADIRIKAPDCCRKLRAPQWNNGEFTEVILRRPHWMS